MPLSFDRILEVQVIVHACWTKLHVGCHFFDSIWEEEEARPSLVIPNSILVRVPNQEGFNSPLPQPLATMLFLEGCPLVRPLKIHCGHVLCHKISLFLKTKNALFCYSSDDGCEHLISHLTDSFFFLRNICTLWWRFLKMRFLFWTQIWWCHSRQGHPQECLIWWWSKPPGEWASSLVVWWWAGHRVTSCLVWPCTWQF